MGRNVRYWCHLKAREKFNTICKYGVFSPNIKAAVNGNTFLQISSQSDMLFFCFICLIPLYGNSFIRKNWALQTWFRIWEVLLYCTIWLCAELLCQRRFIVYKQALAWRETNCSTQLIDLHTPGTCISVRQSNDMMKYVSVDSVDIFLPYLPPWVCSIS